MTPAPLCTQFLNNFSSRNRELWKKADELRHLRKNGLKAWDPRIFLPLDAWILLLEKACPGVGREHFDRLVVGFSTAGAWRPAQDIVRFDRGLQSSLMAAPWPGALPMLEKLPAWCIYFDTGPMWVNGHAVNGFFASLEQNNTRDTLFLRLLFLGHPYLSVPFLIPLGDYSLETALLLSNDLIRRNLAARGQTDSAESMPFSDAGLCGALNLVLHVCVSVRDENEYFARRQPVKTRHGGWRIFPPATPRIHQIGEKAEANPEHCRAATVIKGVRSGPGPHIRRAHWHGYWKGSIKKGEQRRFEMRWLAPVPVAQHRPGGTAKKADP